MRHPTDDPHAAEATAADPSAPRGPRRVLVTGAAGEIGSVLRDGLRGRYPVVRLTDIDPKLGTAGPGEEVALADLERGDDVRAVMDGVDAVVHLGGIANEHTWQRIRAVNVEGTANVFEAAREAGVRRVVFASSVHAVGFHARDPAHPIGPDVPVRPDTYYGVSKVFGEAFGRMLFDKHGVEVACLRICSFQARPRDRRHLSTWLSHGDMVRLVCACLDVPEGALGYRILAGISRNTRRWMDDTGWAEIGYAPVDDAEVYAAEVEHLHGPDDDITEQRQGGIFVARDYVGLAAADRG